MIKSILLKIAFIVLWDTTLLYMTFWTLCKRLQLLVLGSQMCQTQGKIEVQFTYSFLLSTHLHTITSAALRAPPLIWICQKVYKRLFFYRYSSAPENIKNNISNEVVLVIEVCKFSTMYYVLLNLSKHVV
jgi:hypothetical protein